MNEDDLDFDLTSESDAVIGFIHEYISREPEFIDVVEFLGENGFKVDAEVVHGNVIAELEVMYMRWEDDLY